MHMGWLLVLICCFCLLFFMPSSCPLDAIPLHQTLRDGDTSVLSNGQFELGFFNFSSRRYLGIWYKSMAKGTIIWVANRNTPLNNSLGTLKLTTQGNLLLLNSSDIPIWASYNDTARNPLAQLLGTGNLVIREANDEDPDHYLWQSFDHPGNTFMPTMKYGTNLDTDLNRYLTSWKSDDDPSEGAYINKLDPSGFPQMFLGKDNQIVYRSGPWNGERFSGMINLKPNPIYSYEFVNDGKEIYYRYDLQNSLMLSRMVLHTNGDLERLTWTGGDGPSSWTLYLKGQMDDCDKFSRCGPFAKCNTMNSQACCCLHGFEPKDEPAWNRGNWSGGCVRRHKLDCGSDGFQRVSRLKLPDTRKAWYDGSLSLKECKKKCSENCSCVAYANSDVRNGGSGCLMWFGDLSDIREYAATGQDLYLRTSVSDLTKDQNPRWPIKILVPVLAIGVALLVLSIVLHTKFRNKAKIKGIMPQLRGEEPMKETEENDLELPMFSFEAIVNATNNFSRENKLGCGGFGLVYKGILKDGEEVAVKRLSKNSRQGVDEFKNEISCMAKLQHRNLVKLLGCCIKGEERMLIYEFMPNRSLDSFIFARGLAYLHHDSRLRIIHRDIKAANILLDQDLNPKISDFGMAKIFGGEETEANTTRVVGTYGYMAPEYAVDGLFSPKTDVFSFGVLVLEIVSGTKNRGFNHPDHDHNLLGHQNRISQIPLEQHRLTEVANKNFLPLNNPKAWRLYKEGRLLELLDPIGNESCVLPELIRSIHIGLLCVQQSPEDRPSMSMVALLLGSSTELPEPKQRGFFTPTKFWLGDALREILDESANQITITGLDGR
ncbi:hypothetical protein Cgig2_023415 [Carnegiea gigantea]|uniref:Receptor-like serine/threonine-protein kinase n=1 Tax=Carnegiea gigantea TaxID=171969 RepID=A0A9Q1K4F5_9CARY|nr:hypothetical protein Cgig2_023415 [Carnegiea gigantea]